MDTIVIMDYSTAEVFVQKIPIDMLTEDFLTSRGFRESDIAWMRGETIEIHTEI